MLKLRLLGNVQGLALGIQRASVELGQVILSTAQIADETVAVVGELAVTVNITAAIRATRNTLRTIAMNDLFLSIKFKFKKHILRERSEHYTQTGAKSRVFSCKNVVHH